MILGHDNGISLRDIPNPHWTKLAKSIYYSCALLFGVMMLLSKECASLLELSSRGPRYSFYKMDITNISRKSSDQCLVLNENITMEICSDTGKNHRIHDLYHSDLCLNFCNMYKPLILLLPPSVRGNSAHCQNKLHELMDMDREVNSMYQAFTELLDKVDCDYTKFSVKWNCAECKVGNTSNLYCMDVAAVIFKRYLCSYASGDWLIRWRSLATRESIPGILWIFEEFTNSIDRIGLNLQCMQFHCPPIMSWFPR